MSKIHKAGRKPAFPTTGPFEPLVDASYCYPGITIRDWFAGQALAGLLTHTFSDGSDFLHALGAGAAAYQAYRIADAMLIARQTQEGEDA